LALEKFMPTISAQFSLELGHADNLNKAGRRFMPSNQKHGRRGSVAGMEENSRCYCKSHVRPSENLPFVRPDSRHIVCFPANSTTTNLDSENNDQ
jgi:hypothetical protein